MIYPRPANLSNDECIFLIISNKEVLQKDNEKIFPRLTPHLAQSLWQDSSYQAEIGRYQDRPVYMLLMLEKIELSGYKFGPLRSLLGKVDSELFALAGRACQIAYFISTHNYCSHCGEPLQEVEEELAVYCAQCDYRTYPRISPCMIVAVYRGDEVLLARGARHPEGLYSVLAGFVESGESLEQCVHREVFEEARVRIKNLQYVTSQSWPFPHSLMAGFIAEYAGGELTLDQDELLEGGWFRFDNLPTTPPAGTIAAQLIESARTRLTHCG
ncbi:NAD(+) diphosphatase [Aliidiomarina sp. Khilg15.8]